MAKKYKLHNSSHDGKLGSIFRQDIPNLKISIPLDPSNADYQEYLEWVAAGNTAEAAD